MITLSLPFNISAQEYPDTDSLSAPQKTSWLQNRINAFNNAYRHNPEYLKNEANMLKVRLLGTVQLPSIMIHPKSDTEKKVTFSSDPLKYVGADIGWNIFNFGYSYGLDRKNNKNNSRLSFNTYTRFFAINAEILWMSNLSVSDIDNFRPEGEDNVDKYPEIITIDGAYLRSRSLQLKFFPNGKKMAYGNTINPIFRQRKSAGTTVFSLGYADNDFNTNLEKMDADEHAWINEVGINSMNLSKYELGAGYSYNFVISRRWILFLSDIVGISAKHYSYRMLYDTSPTNNTKIGICNYLRTGTCYYNKNYYIGTNILYEFDALSTNQFLFNRTNLTGVVYIGYKFNVDSFNRFVSNTLNVNIK